jgi:hypothetical protein
LAGRSHSSAICQRNQARGSLGKAVRQALTAHAQPCRYLHARHCALCICALAVALAHPSTTLPHKHTSVLSRKHSLAAAGGAAGDATIGEVPIGSSKSPSTDRTVTEYTRPGSSPDMVHSCSPARATAAAGHSLEPPAAAAPLSTAAAAQDSRNAPLAGSNARQARVRLFSVAAENRNPDGRSSGTPGIACSGGGGATPLSGGAASPVAATAIMSRPYLPPRAHQRYIHHPPCHYPHSLLPSVRLYSFHPSHW